MLLPELERRLQHKCQDLVTLISEDDGTRRRAPRRARSRLTRALADRFAALAGAAHLPELAAVRPTIALGRFALSCSGVVLAQALVRGSEQAERDARRTQATCEREGWQLCEVGDC